MEMGKEVQSLFDRYLLFILMSMIVWQNGNLVPEQEVKISPFDPGFTVGRGVFETMLAVRGKVFAWDRHLQRLKKSADVLGLKLPELSGLESAMHEVVLANPECRCEARIRVTLTEGGNLIITAKSIEDYPLQTSAVQIDFPINDQSPLSSIKTLSYAENLEALKQARVAGAGEAIRSNTAGELCEACISNVFFVRDQVIYTPSLETGCLPGITREILLERDPHIQVGRWPISILNEADEIWLTNSIRRLQWVRQFDKRDLGEPSETFFKMRAALDALIEKMSVPARNS